METKELYRLIIKYLDDDILDDEKDLLIKYLEDEGNKNEFKKILTVNYLINKESLNFEYKNPLKKALKKIEKEKGEKEIKFKIWPVLKYAALIVLFVSLGLYLTKDVLLNKSEIVNSNIIEIGTDKAILTLENGVKVSLEKGKSYTSADVVSNGEKIVYKSKKESEQSILNKPEIAYNYLTIPRGGEFFMELADNTKVWLNSESKIKYPIEFLEGETREVELLYGEAYFDVSPSSEHNGDKFKVISQGQEVEVIGTEFNINAYRGKKLIKTTLVEGKVAIKIDNLKEVLKPNQQAIYNKSTELMGIENVNVLYETSWKNGEFNFNGKSLDQIMEVLSRWYNVDYEIKTDSLKTLKFKGTIGKKQNIETILLTLKNTNNISYEITKNKVIIK